MTDHQEMTEVQDIPEMTEVQDIPEMTEVQEIPGTTTGKDTTVTCADCGDQCTVPFVQEVTNPFTVVIVLENTNQMILVMTDHQEMTEVSRYSRDDRGSRYSRDDRGSRNSQGQRQGRYNCNLC